MTPGSEPEFPRLKPAPKTIESLYPHLKPGERAKADYALKRYIALVWRIYQRLRREGKI